MRVLFFIVLVLLGALEGYGQRKNSKSRPSKGDMKWHLAQNEGECGRSEDIIQGYPKQACANLKQDDKLCLCMSWASENWNFICGECSMRWVGDFKGLYKKKNKKQNRNWRRGGSGNGVQNDAADSRATDEERNRRWREYKVNRDKQGKKGGNQDRFNNRQKLRQKMKQNQKQKGGQGVRRQEGVRRGDKTGQEGVRRVDKAGRYQNNKPRNQDGRRRNEVEEQSTSTRPTPVKAPRAQSTSVLSQSTSVPSQSTSVPNKSTPTPEKSTTKPTPKKSTTKPTPNGEKRRKRRDAK